MLHYITAFCRGFLARILGTPTAVPTSKGFRHGCRVAYYLTGGY